VTTYFVLGTGVVVAAIALLGRWPIRILDHHFYAAHAALPWLALAWALYGLYQVVIVITGRARATGRNVPATVAGLAVNIGLLVVLVPRSGAGLGIAGAAIALCGAYAVMLAIMHLLTRRLFAVRFEWTRLGSLVGLLAAVAVSGELLLPTHGAAGLLLRALWLAWIPAALAAMRFFSPAERTQARALVADARVRVTAFRRGGGVIEGFAEDPLKDL
jgi:O-antigen/teichoic acid export membrane protein